MRHLRPLVVIGFAAAIAIRADAAARDQDPQPAQPPSTFRSAVDLVAVDVNVMGDGKPVTGLRATDFILTVDGAPRRISSAEYVSAASAPKPAAADAPTGLPTFSANTVAGGRLILFVVDQGSIGPGRGRAAMESAIRFISQLSPADRVGLITIPSIGSQIDFTSNHALVQAALPRLVGQAETFPTNYRIGVSEALAVQQADRTVTATMIERECAGIKAPEEIEFCRTQVLRDALGIYSLVSERTHNSIGVLRQLVDRLSQTSIPKTIVYISEGLVIERMADLTWLGSAASRGRVTIHALQLDAPTADASSAREAATPGRDRTLAREGLEWIAGSTRGGFFQFASAADSAFNRLVQELSGYYLLSFEPDAGDRDGKPHKIKVTAPGRNVDIRARSEFTVDAGTARKTDETALAEMLKAPFLSNEIGLKLSAFTMRDPASDKLRILMATEIDRTGNPDGKLSLAYLLTDDKGRILASQIDREIRSPVDPANVQTYTGFIVSEATGPHVLRVAVIDDRGRRGSVEHNFRAALTPVGPYRVTDMVVADDRATPGTMTPVLSGEFTNGMVTGFIELYADSPDALKSATVVFEVAQNEGARALDGAAGKTQPASADSPNKRAIEGSVPTALLPPGDYVIRAVVSADGQKLGHVARSFRVGRTVAATKATPAVGLKPRSTVPFTSKIERFERASVLTPQVVGFFMERMNLSSRGEPNAATTIEHARAGRFDEAVQSLAGRTGSIAAPFLGGLALYSKGELEAAAAKFRETLRLDSEFFPAAFYLGSCYAAGGRDQEAVGAWQLSLVTESEAPFIFTLLGDALLRLRDPQSALEILKEAEAEWPDSEEVQVRLGSAYAMAGKRVEALEKLEPYLDKHPEDLERLFVALRTLYQAKSDGKPVRSADADRDLFTKLAAAYSAGKGPQLPIVEQWLRAMVR
ncbi:MAG TPA: VWA domain-containing protein [Vicinamibacterales bacterium]